MHDYLGMTLDFSVPGKLTINMMEYIKTMIAGMPEDMVGIAKTPAGPHFFKVDESGSKPLSQEKTEVFHRIVMQLQYLSLRGRPDIRTAVSFLTKRVTNSDEDDY